MWRKVSLSSVLLLGFACISCDDPWQSKGEFNFDDPSGKSDQLAQTHLIDDIALNSTIDGTFNDRIRVYGFTVEAKAGAVVKVEVTTKAGAGSSDAAEGSTLDTVLAAYGPVNAKNKGPKIAEADDEGENLAGQLAPLSIKQDGRYLVLMSTWNDPGKGSYRIKVGCQGTDFQCRRPVNNGACTAGTRYITGGTVISTGEWKDCEVVLMETVEVEKGAVLTVRPGVTVKGNYIGTGAFGTVQLVVNGTLQSVGTKDAPVVFTALKDGWKGLVLKGDSNTLQQTFVEKAETGVTLEGSNNKVVDVNINSGNTGIYIVKGSSQNVISRARLGQVADGIRLAGSASIADSVFQGKGADPKVGGSGIWGDGGAPVSQVERCLFTNFPRGMHLISTEVEVRDTTIIGNAMGVEVNGANGGVHPPYTCPAVPQGPTPTYRPPVPTTWGRDPIFVRCDIIKNAAFGVKITAPELLVIEDSNVRDNGAGIVIECDSLHNDSRIVRSNIFRNGEAAQVDSYHVNGVLNISGNYWAKISDPELSASWRMQHSQQVTCTGDSNGNPGCSHINNGRYQCGTYQCTWNGSAGRMVSCTMTMNATWTGQITFTGFSPTPLSAGPKLGPQSDLVQQQRQQLGL